MDCSSNIHSGSEAADLHVLAVLKRRRNESEVKYVFAILG